MIPHMAQGRDSRKCPLSVELCSCSGTAIVYAVLLLYLVLAAVAQGYVEDTDTAVCISTGRTLSATRSLDCHAQAVDCSSIGYEARGAKYQVPINSKMGL